MQANLVSCEIGSNFLFIRFMYFHLIVSTSTQINQKIDFNRFYYTGNRHVNWKMHIDDVAFCNNFCAENSFEKEKMGAIHTIISVHLKRFFR